jgi:DNA-binding GntR family transcriptional regulator
MAEDENRLDNRVLRDAIYEHIREMIENNEFLLDEKINKIDLAKKFNVSSTPINDALNRLVGEHYLVQRNRKGYYVREYDAKEMRDFFEMRAALEGLAASLVCQRANDEDITRLTTIFDGFSSPIPESRRIEYVETDQRFHRTILEKSGNKLILDAAESTGFLWRSYQKGLVRNMETSFKEHKEIIVALKERDGVLAQKKMMSHLLRSSREYDV